MGVREMVGGGRVTDDPREIVCGWTRRGCMRSRNGRGSEISAPEGGDVCLDSMGTAQREEMGAVHEVSCWRLGGGGWYFSCIRNE